MLEITGESEAFTLGIFKSYSDLKDRQSKLSLLRKERELLLTGPTETIIPLNQIKFRKLDFAPIVKKLFDLKTEI